MTTKELDEHLEKIRLDHGGVLRHSDIWRAAQGKPDHPLYNEFDWNIQEAAENWWDEQARRLIRRVTVVRRVHHIEVRAPKYVHDPELPAGEPGYRPVVSFRSEEETAKRVLFDELDRVISSLSRARSVAAVLGLEADLEVLLAQAGAFREQAEVAA